MGETSSADYQPLITAPSASPSAPSGQFRPQVFDPALVTMQIGAVQAIFYASSTTLLLIGCRAVGFPQSLKYLFDPDQVSLQSATGRWIIVMYFFNALALAFAMQLLVKRSKLCLDFIATCMIIHLIICWVYTLHFPLSISWWSILVMSAILATSLGEWLCLRIEMEAIPVSQAKTDV